MENENTLDLLEEMLGVVIGDELKAIHRKAKSTDDHQLETFGDVFYHMAPGIPNGFIPLIHEATGNLGGLYFPRENRSQFLAATFPLDGNGNLYPLPYKPEEMLRELKRMDQGFWSMTKKKLPEYLESESLRMLFIDPMNIEIGTEDLLKPFPLNSVFLYNLYPELEEEPVPANVRVRGAPESDIFTRPEDLLRLRCWREYANYCRESNRPLDTLRALENAHAVIWRYPHFGFPGETAQDSFRIAAELWNEMRELDAGDKFDRFIIAHQCENAQRWNDRARSFE